MNSNIQQTHSEEEIDLIALLEKLWKGKNTVIKSVTISFIIGLLVAILSPKEFTAKSIIIPQTSGNKTNGRLGNLAAIAGIDLGNGNSEGIPPALYPKIVQSIPFQKELIKTTLNFRGIDSPVTYEEYYKKYAKPNILGIIRKYTIGLPRLLFSSKPEDISYPTQINDSTGIYNISREDKSLFGLLNNQLVLKINDKEGFVELNFSMPDAVPAAEMAERAQNLLQTAITNFKIKKAKQQLNFIKEQYEEAQKDFKEKQFALAKFQDQNRGLNSSLSQTRLERLRSDYNLSYSVFSELAKQLETQKIQVKEDTPVFTIIEPVSIPLNKSKPRRGMIIAIWTFLGFVIGIGIIFIRNFIEEYKAKRSE